MRLLSMLTAAFFTLLNVRYFHGEPDNCFLLSLCVTASHYGGRE